MTSLLLRHARRLGAPAQPGRVPAAGGPGPSWDEPGDLWLRDGRVVVPGDPVTVDEVVDLDGRRVLPGLWDAHVHLTQWAADRTRLDLAGATSAADAARLVGRRLAAAERPSVLVGRGFAQAGWPDVPHRALLDAVAGEVPVVLVAVDLHCAWASSAGLALLGLSGHPTGVLREAEWMGSMAALAPAAEQADAAVAEALREAAARGVVGVLDVEIDDNLATWRRRAWVAPPATRVRAGVWEPHLAHVLADGLRTGDPIAPRVTQGPLKVIVDGSLNTRTAYCREPYPGGVDRGVLSVEPDHLRALLARATAAGLAGMVHAIGDAALDVALDAYAALPDAARAAASAAGRPLGSVEHVQLLAPGQAARTAALGLVAGVQPRHAVDDRDVLAVHWPDRLDRAYRYRDLADAGVRLAFGSDAPVAPLDPWLALDAAVRRTGDARPAWAPDQCLDVRTALAASVDGVPLHLPVGAPADVVVLDDDPVAAAAAGTLAMVRVAGTLLAGDWTHRAF